MRRRRGRRHIVQLFLFSIDYDLKSFSLSDLISTKMLKQNQFSLMFDEGSKININVAILVLMTGEIGSF